MKTSELLEVMQTVAKELGTRRLKDFLGETPNVVEEGVEVIPLPDEPGAVCLIIDIGLANAYGKLGPDSRLFTAKVLIYCDEVPIIPSKIVDLYLSRLRDGARQLTAAVNGQPSEARQVKLYEMQRDLPLIGRRP